MHCSVIAVTNIFDCKSVLSSALVCATARSYLDCASKPMFHRLRLCSRFLSTKTQLQDCKSWVVISGEFDLFRIS